MKWYLVLCGSLILTACQPDTSVYTPTGTHFIQVTQEDTADSWWGKAKDLWGNDEQTTEQQSEEKTAPAIEEPAPENTEDESKSWWDKAKDSTKDMWDKANQSVEEYVGQDEEEQGTVEQPVEEAAPENTEDESKSWWDKAKDSTKDMWDKANQSVEEYIGQDEEQETVEQSTEEPAPENTEDESKSWWDKAKDSTKDMWDKANQSVEEYIGQDEEQEKSLTEPDTEPTQQYEKNPYFGNIWEEVTPRINQILALEEKQTELPESGWFTETKESNQNKLNQLLDEAVEMLSLSESNQIRQKIRTLEQEIAGLKNTIAEYRQAQVSAPIESTWKITVEQYNEKIVNVQDQIAQKYQQIDTLKLDFAQSLRKIGIHLSNEQLDVLFSSVLGDDIIQASVVYENVKLMNEQLMELTINSGEDFTFSKRYYGMSVVLLKILFHMQDSFISDIDHKYMPKIAEIVNSVQAIKTKTQNLLRAERDDKRREHLLANLDAQQLTVKTAELYKQHLLKQRQKMLTTRDKTLADLLVAENTFATVTVSSELVGLLRTSQKAFELLQNMQTPDLLIFENLQMKQEFAILTDKINS